MSGDHQADREQGLPRLTESNTQRGSTILQASFSDTALAASEILPFGQIMTVFLPSPDTLRRPKG